MISIAAYLALFATVGFLFVFAALLLGRFLRAQVPTPEKGETYECGEPAVGSSYVQFDLRFYVVALLFIIFDVEVAFFFPWATVFGKATQLVDLNQRIEVAERAEAKAQTAEAKAQTAKAKAEWVGAAAGKYGELGLDYPQLHSDVGKHALQNQAGARWLALAAALDVAVFFAVLLVGFAYVWTRGDLDWVRTASWRQFRSAGPLESHPPAVTTQ
ncbi:MAG: NADH-quinone oxidoreductase subunit A [Planctomycetota bacterium]